MGLVDSGAFSGHLHKNPFNFQHFHVRNVLLRVNGKAVPFENINLDFENNKYLLGYLSLYQGSDTLYSDNSFGISPDSYKNGHTLYAFDLEANTSCGGEMSLIKEGNVSVEIKLSQTTDRSVTLIAYLEYRDMIELDNSLTVLSESGMSV